jgi:hypothetical protein
LSTAKKRPVSSRPYAPVERISGSRPSASEPGQSRRITHHPTAARHCRSRYRKVALSCRSRGLARRLPVALRTAMWSTFEDQARTIVGARANSGRLRAAILADASRKFGGTPEDFRWRSGRNSQSLSRADAFSSEFHAVNHVRRSARVLPASIAFVNGSVTERRLASRYLVAARLI